MVEQTERTERQNIAIRKWMDNGARGTIVMTTGVGKTRTALMSIIRMKKHYPDGSVLVVVPTEELKNQWKRSIDEIGLGIYDNIRVEIINTVIMHKWEVSFVICDESHMFLATTFIQVFSCVRYRYIMCLSATMERIDGREAILKKFCPIVDEITLDEALKNNWVSKFNTYLVLIEPDDKDEYDEIIRQFSSIFSFFDFNFKLAIACLSDWKIRTQYSRLLYTGNDPKKKSDMNKTILSNAVIFSKIMHRKNEYIHNHHKKFEVLNRILDSRKDKKIITFCPSVESANKLALERNEFTIHSKLTKKKREKMMNSFNNSDIGVMHTSKALDAGVDIRGLNVGIILNVNSSKVTSVQRRGRVIRFSPDKVAELFILVMKGTSEEKWFYNSNTDDKIITINESQLDLMLEGKDYRHIYGDTFINRQKSCKLKLKL